MNVCGFGLYHKHATIVDIPLAKANSQATVMLQWVQITIVRYAKY
jgi:hypothetical protein